MKTVTNKYDPWFGPVVMIKVMPAYKKASQREWIELTALVDSGARKTVLPEEVVERLKLNRAWPQTVETITGETIFWIYSCRIIVDNLEKEFTKLVVATKNVAKDSAILGRDIVDNLIVNLHGPDKTLTITDPY